MGASQRGVRPAVLVVMQSVQPCRSVDLTEGVAAVMKLLLRRLPSSRWGCPGLVDSVPVGLASLKVLHCVQAVPGGVPSESRGHEGVPTGPLGLLQSFSRRPDGRIDLRKGVERVTGIEPAWPA